MTDIDQGVELELEDEPASGGKKTLFILIAAVLLLLGAGGAGYYFFFANKGAEKPVEAPLPAFLDLKPFVVTLPSRNGPSHFVQLGLSFQLASSAASEMITAVLPKVQDGMRQTLLAFKCEDLQSPDGVDRARAAMLARVNEVLAQVLGPERIEKGSGGKTGVPLVANIYFATLIIE